MATIRSQMVLNDQVTGVLKNITRALDITLHSFEQMQDASANAVDVRLLNQARAGLGEVNLAVREMEENYRRAAQQEQQVTRNIRQSTQAEQQYFCRFFKKYLGKTPMAYINTYRLQQAALLLETTDIPITTLCLECGFNNLGHFFDKFKSLYGITPLQFRKGCTTKSQNRI